MNSIVAFPYFSSLDKSEADVLGHCHSLYSPRNLWRLRRNQVAVPFPRTLTFLLSTREFWPFLNVKKRYSVDKLWSTGCVIHGVFGLFGFTQPPGRGGGNEVLFPVTWEHLITCSEPLLAQAVQQHLTVVITDFHPSDPVTHSSQTRKPRFWEQDDLCKLREVVGSGAQSSIELWDSSLPQDFPALSMQNSKQGHGMGPYSFNKVPQIKEFTFEFYLFLS